MTPLELSIIIHYRACANDFRNGDFSAPAVSDAIEGFLLTGMLQPTNAHPDRFVAYEITDRGRVFVDYLTTVSLPEWRMP